ISIDNAVTNVAWHAHRKYSPAAAVAGPRHATVAFMREGQAAAGLGVHRLSEAANACVLAPEQVTDYPNITELGGELKQHH
ncbi:hypothetical protein, partial [Streptomyces bacillaris]|uniref:hypothetical protein n=1 Tax=Streptomyces bacillaris TaxID=68179 RepID=UPI00345FDA52